jgi:glycosyltransferase involved in cell wall biosynthesis
MPGAWTIGFNMGLFVNQHLLKDVGLVPYMLGKVYGFTPGILGCEPGEYPYLRYMPEMRLEALPPEPKEYAEACARFLRGHAEEMDLVCMVGAYPFYRQFLDEYRKLRPDGKAYMALDANIFWTDRMNWVSPEFCAILDRCDVIATSGRALQRHLNRKWNRWAINYVPNGFFNPTGQNIEATFAQKENVLLTVGRIGLPEKGHDTLLEAFAQAFDALRGWRLHMVGAVEEGFKPYVVQYFERYPHLRESVIFKGLIENKSALYAEYARAKVFALTSHVEGGAPNVAAEALFHGCYMVTSTIDACEDITNRGECGMIFPVGDTARLAEILREICAEDSLFEAKFASTLAYAKNNFDWELIIKRLHHLLYGQ